VILTGGVAPPLGGTAREQRPTRAADGGWRRASISGNGGTAARGGGGRPEAARKAPTRSSWLSRHTSGVLAIQPLVWYIWAKEREI